MASDYSKNYGLCPKWYGKRKSWAVDQDYVSKLSASEKAWLDRFNREYHGGDLRKGDPKNIHNTDELRKDCYRRNNKQNRDLLTNIEARGMLSHDVESAHNKETFLSKDGYLFRKPCQLTRKAVSYAKTYLSALRGLRVFYEKSS